MKSQVASGGGPAIWKTALEQGLAVDADLDGAEVSADRLLVDDDAEAGGIRRGDLPVRIAVEVVGSDLDRERLRRGGVLADAVVGQPSEGLERRRERKVRGEGG